MISEAPTFDLHQWVEQATRAGRALQRQGREIHGIKPFYVNIRAFEANRRDLMVLGINPGGDAEGERQEQACGYLPRIMDPKGGPFCSITGGPNGEAAADKQRYATRVRVYLASLLGWGSNPSSRDPRFCLVPLGNLNPFRSASTSDQDEAVWSEGVALGLAVIAATRPKFLVLIGTGEGRSAWGTLSRACLGGPGKDSGIWIPKETEVPGAKSARLAWGTGDQATEVLALAHPKVPITNEIYARQVFALGQGFQTWKQDLRLADPYQRPAQMRLAKAMVQ